jgi:hypothetical protein
MNSPNDVIVHVVLKDLFAINIASKMATLEAFAKKMFAHATNAK